MFDNFFIILYAIWEIHPTKRIKGELIFNKTKYIQKPKGLVNSLIGRLEKKLLLKKITGI